MKYVIYVCPKCKAQLEESLMGKPCNKCGDWQYTDLAKKEVIIENKDLMLSLCDCDRHEDVHLEGCRYLRFKELEND